MTLNEYDLFAGREDNDRVAEEVPSEASEPEMNVSYEGDNSRQGLDTRQDEKDSSDIQIKTVLVEDISNRTSSSSSSEEDEPFYKIDKDAILKSIASPALRSFAGDPSHPSSSLLENTREDEQFYYPNRPMHRTPCQSIASGLQVEVSEVGSPPLTNDSISSADEEISIDGEIEKAIVSSNEDALMSSSHLARVDENESRSIEVREVAEQDIVEFGFSRFQMSQNNVPHNNPSERLTEPDSIGSSSFPPPRTERSQASSYQQRRPEGVSVVNERFQASLLQPEFAVQPPFPSPALPSPTSVLQPDCLIEQGSSSNYDQVQNYRAVNISSERSDSIASQESVFSLNNSTLQVSELPSETDNSVSAKENDSDGEQLCEEVVFSTIGRGHHSIEASSTSSSKSVSQPNFATDQGFSSNFSQQTPMDTVQVEPQRVKNKLPNEVTAESCDPKTSPSSTLLSKESTAQSSVPTSQAQKFSNNSKFLTSNDFQETLCDNGGQHIEVVAFTTTSQSFDDSQASSSPQDLDPIPAIQSERAANQDFSSLQSSAQEFPTASSSSSSPKSGLQPKSSTGQGFPLISDLEKREEIKQFDGQTMKCNLPEEQIGESLGQSMSHNTRTLLNDSVADQHHPADAKTVQLDVQTSPSSRTSYSEPQEIRLSPK